MTAWNDKRLLELIKMASATINFDQLIADGVLRQHGAKYEY